MTCIAGIAHDGGVTIGGDSAAISGYDLTVTRTPKVFQVGDYLIGYTTSFRMGQLLQYGLKPPEAPKGFGSIAGFMATRFIDAVRDCLKAGGYAAKTNEQETGGAFLVGFKGRLFRVDGDYQVLESAAGYDACGCGVPYAKASLWTTGNLGIRDPAARIRVALEAAEAHNAGVRGPFLMLDLV